MTNLKNRTATITLIALMSASPIVAFASETGSPQQSVVNDSDEAVSKKPVSGESMENTAKADQGEDAYEDADVVENVDGSLEEDDAKVDG